MYLHDRNIVHLDLDSFFVSVERLHHKDLIGIPLIIGGTSDRGVVASCSYEARKFGVRSAMPMRMARYLCPDATIIRGDMEAYATHSKMVTEVIYDRSPLFEKASIDEFYIDVSGMDKFFGCLKWTSELRQTITKETGLPISFGLSTNKTVAKMATNEAKPNGQLEIPGMQVRPFLDPLSIRKIPMLGEKTFRLLWSMGINTIKVLSSMPREMLEQVLGKNGTSLWKKANGIDHTPVIPYTEAKSVSTERTFDKDTTDIQQLKAMLIGMVERIAFTLRKNQQLAATISVKIRYTNFDTHTRQVHMPYTANDDILIKHVNELFDKVYDRRMLLRLIGVRAGKLVRGGHQIDLFSDTAKMINLYSAIDQMKNRYGSDAVRRAIGFDIKDRKVVTPGG